MAGRRLTNLSYEDWIEYVFSHPVRIYQPRWYDEPDSERWDAAATTKAHYLTRLFEDSEPALAFFADSQIAQGLTYLIDPGASDHALSLLDDAVLIEERLQGLRATYSLFAHLFDRRCTPHLSHRDEPGAGPLNGVCYMWWDVFPAAAAPRDPNRRAIDEAILSTMDRILQLSSPACRESALHGLGHWQRAYPATVTAIIDSFLDRHLGLSGGLRAYAHAARTGCVL
jgi:hypothetical protein